MSALSSILMDDVSAKARFFVSLSANVGRAGISFLTGIIIARVLSPIGYGDLFFLLGSFTAVRALMDMGASSAFYTFITQQNRDRSFYTIYFFWLAFQFLISVSVILMILPISVLDQVWLGHTREVILLAFLASFVQQQVWTTVVQIFEAARLTVLVQITGIMVVIFHLFIVLLLMWLDWVSVNTILVALLSEYALASLFIWKLYKQQEKVVDNSTSIVKNEIREVLFQYWVFCKPLVLIAAISFCYQFLDRWLLQYFGGAEEQGFYQVAAQFAAVSLLATASILNIFWKEIAEAYKKENHERVRYLYGKISRSLVMLGAIVSCFLIPWSEPLTLLLLGEAYISAWPVLAVMFFYPVHQSMGQINATMFMACERTKSYMYLGLVGMFIGMPVTCFLLISSDGWFVQGLELGALGLAIKMVVLNILLVNVQSWLLASHHKWKYEWKYQIEALVILLILSYSIKLVVTFYLSDGKIIELNEIMILILMSITGFLYLFSVSIYLWYRPCSFGLERDDVTRTMDLLIRKCSKNAD